MSREFFFRRQIVLSEACPPFPSPPTPGSRSPGRPTSRPKAPPNYLPLPSGWWLPFGMIEVFFLVAKSARAARLRFFPFCPTRSHGHRRGRSPTCTLGKAF